MRGELRQVLWTWLVVGVLGLALPHANRAEASTSETENARARCFILELYVSGDAPASKTATTRLEKFVAQRVGYSLRRFDVQTDLKAKERLDRICQHFKIEPGTPRAYCGGVPIVDFGDEAALARKLEQTTTLTVYVRSGCSRCDGAKRALPLLSRDYPALKIQLRDIVADPQANVDLQALVRQHQASAASVPVFEICGQLSIGFSNELNTRERLDAILKPWTVVCPSSPEKAPANKSSQVTPALAPLGAMMPLWVVGILSSESGDEALPLPGDALPLPESSEEIAEAPPVEDEIDLPVFGRLTVRSVGMPLFTLAVGLVDGFNPCAMWVLLFLLSVLVNLRSRWKILAVAGTFVVISAIAYFAFMAAWFSVFQLVGVLREVQIAIAVLAICIGLVHVKDFFAFKRGISLSIPEATKPGIYDRVRRIVTAENLVGAIVATSVLAVLVNIVELLCTAGLPALYTQILNAQQLPRWQNYAYLLLYNVGYMFDDGLMVALVVITLERHKLQETQGRWLKLLSGTAVLVLGILMLFRPEWLGI